MNKSELIDVVANKSDYLSHQDTEDSINLILNFLSSSLAIGNRAEVRGFGTFSIRKRNKRIARNPKSGKSIEIQAKYHPYFRASKSLKKSLNTNINSRSLVFDHTATTTNPSH